jgi:hexosaminidase
MTYPRAWALAEVYWSPSEKKNWEDFTTRMEKHFERFDMAEINYSKAVYDAIIRTYYKDGKLMLAIEGEVPNLDIYYSMDDTMPDNYAAKFVEPIAVPNGPVTLRTITYRNGKPIGHLITLKRAELERRAR